MVVPFWAVTTVLIVLGPATKAILPEAVPEAIVTPFTLIVAFGSTVVAVTVTDETALLTDVVYVMVLPTVPLFTSVEAGVSLIALSKALADSARVTVMVYVLVVTPSWAVTTVVMVLGPTAKAILPDAVPELIVTPFTATVAVWSLVVGVTVMVETALLTDAV